MDIDYIIELDNQKQEIYGNHREIEHRMRCEKNSLCLNAC